MTPNLTLVNLKLMTKEGYETKKAWFTPKYILLYLVFALVVYGLVYYFWLGKGYLGARPKAPVYDMSSKESAGVQAEPQTTWKIDLKEQNRSGLTGTATIAESGGKTKVLVILNGQSVGTPMPVHIHVGSCPKPGAIKFPLNTLAAGASDTTLEVTVDQLKAMEPLAINIHKSAVDLASYVACGDLK